MNIYANDMTLQLFATLKKSFYKKKFLKLYFNFTALVSLFIKVQHFEPLHNGVVQKVMDTFV